MTNAVAVRKLASLYMKAEFKFSWVDIKSINGRIGIVLFSSLRLLRTSVNRKEDTAEEHVEKGNSRYEARKTKSYLCRKKLRCLP